MKKFFKTFIFIWIILSIFSFIDVNSANIDIQWSEDIIDSSIKVLPSWNIVEDIESIWIRILWLVKLVFEWVLIIYIVYAWIQMIMSMWSDEDALTKSKTSIRYSIIALIFINIPYTLSQIFIKDPNQQVRIWAYKPIWSSYMPGDNNMFVNMLSFWETLNTDIVWFIEVILWIVTILLIIFYWIKIILSNWKEEELTKSINKITWSIWGLIFIWFIEVWKNFVFKWKISDWAEIFSTLSNLALFFAWPIAIAFLTLAAYYYITSNWNEDRVKKAKSIVVNTVIATVILLASYTFLLDLSTLNP